MNIGVNIYCLRRRIGKRRFETWQALKAIGISHVELLMFENESLLTRTGLPKEIADLVKELRKVFFTYSKTLRVIAELGENMLSVESIHVKLDKSDLHYPERYAKNLMAFSHNSQISDFVIGIDGFIDNLVEWIPSINGITAMMKTNNLRLICHNHDKECSKFGDSTYLEYALDNCPDLKVEADVGWLAYAGVDVVRFLSRYRDRLVYIHLKDFVVEDNQIVFTAIGYGNVPIDKVLEFARNYGFTDKLIIDQDDSIDIITDLQKGIEYIRKYLDGHQKNRST